MKAKDLEKILEATHQFSSRQIGKTYMAAQLTKKVGGILIEHNQHFANEVAKQYGVTTASIQTFRPEGTNRPLIIDQDALVFECLSLIYENKKLQRVVEAVSAFRYAVLEGCEAGEFGKLGEALKQLEEI